MKITESVNVDVEIEVNANDIVEEVLSDCSQNTRDRAILEYVDVDMLRQKLTDFEILETLDKDEIMDYAINHCSKLGKLLQGE